MKYSCQNLRKIGAIFLCAILLSGCAQNSHYYQARSNTENLADLTALVWNLEIDENKTLLVDIQVDSSERLASAGGATSAAASSLASTPLPAGTSSGEAIAGVAVGMVLGMQIVKSIQDSNDRIEANKKAAPIEVVFSRQVLVDMMRSFITDAVNDQERISFVQTPAGKMENSSVNLLFAEPELHFNADLTRLEIKLNATIKNAGSKKLIYQNSFEYWSQPIGENNQCEGNCNLWIKEEGKTLTSHLREGCEEVVSMLLYDLEKTSMPPNAESSQQKTHRIVSKRGTVFLRSSLVKEEEDRVWLKDLRGNLRSIYGKLEQAGI